MRLLVAEEAHWVSLPCNKRGSRCDWLSGLLESAVSHSPLQLCVEEMIKQTLGMTGNPVPEAKWVLRGRIVTNNTSPLYGNNDNIQYVIHEKGDNIHFHLTLFERETSIDTNGGRIIGRFFHFLIDCNQMKPPLKTNTGVALEMRIPLWGWLTA